MRTDPSDPHRTPARHGRIGLVVPRGLVFAMGLVVAVVASAQSANESSASAARRQSVATSKDSPASSGIQRPPRTRIATSLLAPLLAQNLGDWALQTLEKASSGREPTSAPALRGVYVKSGTEATLSIADLGARSATTNRWSGSPVDRKTPTGSEKMYKSGSRIVHETFTEASGETQVTYTLANGLQVAALSTAADAAALVGLIESLDLAHAEAIPRPSR
jgi:hypothetical protein